jgi:hypothetical protein
VPQHRRVTWPASVSVECATNNLTVSQELACLGHWLLTPVIQACRADIIGRLQVSVASPQIFPGTFSGPSLSGAGGSPGLGGSCSLVVCSRQGMVSPPERHPHLENGRRLRSFSWATARSKAPCPQPQLPLYPTFHSVPHHSSRRSSR